MPYPILPSVVTGKLSIFIKEAYILFDYGLAHTSSFANLLWKTLTKLDTKSIEWTPAESIMNATNVLKSCKVEIDRKFFTVDMIVLDMFGFDVIFCMDGMSK